MSDVISETPAPKIRWGQLLAWGLVIGLLGLVAFQMRRNGPLAAGPVGVGEKAPEFALATFDGKTYALAGLRGQVVVINFWASWCGPCEEEAADLENTWRHYAGQAVVFIGIDYVDTETEARAFLKRFDITYPNGPDLGTRIAQAYRIKGVPETYIVDKTGRLAFIRLQPMTQPELMSIIDPLLQQ